MTFHVKMKYEPTSMLKHPDTILSSDYPHVKVFIPSYERRCEKPNIFYLLSMEYQRIWMKEKEVYRRSIRSESDKKKNTKKHLWSVAPTNKPDNKQKQKDQKEISPKWKKKYEHIKAKVITRRC